MFHGCTRLAESDVTVTPSVTYVGWLCWWYKHTNHVVFSSTALAFLTNMSEKCECTSPGTIQVKNQGKVVGVGEIRCNKLTWKRWMNCWHMP